MKSWLSAIGPAIGAGLSTGVLWWSVNAIQTVNGVGWLERQVWPLNNLYLVAAGGTVLGFLAGLGACARQRRRAHDIASLGLQWGFRYDAEVARGEFPAMPLFAHGSDGSNRLAGEMLGVPIESFDLTQVTKGNESSTTTHQTVFLLPAETLPEFDLVPRRAVVGLMRMVGIRGLTFDPQAVRDPVGSVEVELFNRQCFVTAGEEPAVRTLFSPPVMKQLNRFPGWSIQSRGGRLVCWRGDRLEPASTYRDRLAEALEIRTALVQGAAQADADEAVPGLPEPVLRRETARARVGVLGGCVGTVLGFFTGFFVFVALNLGLKPAFEQFWLTAIMFFGSIFLGAALGGVLGTILVRWAAGLLPGGLIPAALGQPLPGVEPARGGWTRDQALRAQRQPPRIFCLVFAGMGTLFALFALGWGVWSAVFALGAQRTEGTVIRMVAPDGGDGSKPVVQYQVDGETYECEGSISSSPPAYSVGQKVSVLYRPDEPQKALIGSFVDRWLLPLVFGGAGSLFAAIGFALLIHRWRQDEAKTTWLPSRGTGSAVG